MVFIKQFCAVFRLFFFGLMCLFYNYAVIAGQTSELDEKLLKAISHNNLAEVQRFVAEGASTEVSNASGLSAIDIAVDNGFYDIAHFLIEAHKKNLQVTLAHSNKKVLNSRSPSIIDKVSNFFKSEASEVPIRKNTPKLPVTRKASIVNNYGSGINLFTKLTDVILNFLPDGTIDAPQTLNRVKLLELRDAKAPEDEKVFYPVTDFTKSTEDPYRIEKRVQTKTPPLPRTPDKVNSRYVAKAKLADILTLPKAVPRNIKQKDLVFGGRGRLGDLFKATEFNAESCIVKSSWKSSFCIEAFNWPSPIQKVVGTFGGLVGNGHSIVHYVNVKSVQFHGLFQSQSFSIIASLLTSYLGAPTETFKMMTSMLAADEVQNRVFRWVAAATDDQLPLILEIREIDDLRWSLPPDPLNGVIRMYWKGEPSVFKILTAADLLLLKIRKGGQQKTLRMRKP
jgi:hypothetical protein